MYLFDSYIMKSMCDSLDKIYYEYALTDVALQELLLHFHNLLSSWRELVTSAAVVTRKAWSSAFSSGYLDSGHPPSTPLPTTSQLHWILQVQHGWDVNTSYCSPYHGMGQRSHKCSVRRQNAATFSLLQGKYKWVDIHFSPHQSHEKTVGEIRKDPKQR